jgi:hypothetical protein
VIIWGFTKSKEIERLHLKFCKKILNVKVNSCNVAVYGELARYPLYISRYVKILRFWFKMLETDNIILKNVYSIALEDCNNGKTNWLSNLKLLLCNHGFSDIWDFPDSVNSKIFLPIFKQRVIDCFLQSWLSGKESSPVLYLYNHVKDSFVYENYLDIIPSTLRKYLTRIRISSHSLHVQTGRFHRNRIVRNERYCLYCNLHDVEDEYHFILICPCYIDIRKNI